MAGVRRKEEEKWTSSEGRRVFIPRESGGWGDAGRLARNGRAKPQRATVCLEAGRGAPFTRTEIIFCVIIFEKASFENKYCQMKFKKFC